MHRIILSLILIIPILTAAQAPEKINFQSIIRDKEGVIWSNKAVSLKIGILEGGANGTITYLETHNKTTDMSGLISLQIGTGNIISGAFHQINWGNAPHFIRLEADFEGGSQFLLLGTQLLSSVPYALFTNVADTSLHEKAEIDPVFNLSIAKGISQADTAYWNKRGNNPGDIQVWNGSIWVNVPAGMPGQTLTISPNGIPGWLSSLNTVLPTVSMTGLSEIFPNSVRFNAQVLSDGGGHIISKGIVYGTQMLPTLLDQSIINGTANVAFEGTITELLPNTPYYFRAFATNEQGTRYSNQLLENTTSLVTDVDGNIYQGVKIGTQIWLNKNLMVTKYQNRDTIYEVTPDGLWQNLLSGGWSNIDNTADNNETYGKLYNWFAVSDERKLCPQGWKIPSDEEWTILTSYLGGLDVAGGKLKSTGITFWGIPNAWANNLSFFTGLPSGYRDQLGLFFGVGYYAIWWTSTSNGAEAWSRYVYNEFNYASKETLSKNQGLSIRCLSE
jgi:uncharacterized protein (TIGR02145 family)